MLRQVASRALLCHRSTLPISYLSSLTKRNPIEIDVASRHPYSRISTKALQELKKNFFHRFMINILGIEKIQLIQRSLSILDDRAEILSRHPMLQNLIPLQSWYVSLNLYYWILHVRVRKDISLKSKAYLEDIQYFWYERSETKLLEMGITGGLIVSVHLNQLLRQYLGAMLSYDEGLYLGDMSLANSLHKNFFTEEEEFDLEHIALTVKYVHSQIKHLDNFTIEEIMNGDFYFEDFPTEL
eukprot:TRINITY_DN10882_c0_g1_i1.p1 TRINITY_DN10882_c0_g1~~TRINITY_DN10882_c0_g1_i1.p1  ORF type:complete len:241 (-),score=82.97 TRINITY_DN10882_c0_g1_i1:111-833(-)